MTPEVLTFLSAHPGRIAVFEAVETQIAALGESQMAVGKSQISWGNPLKFAFLSLPRFPAPDGALTLTFGLGHRLDHPRIAQAVEPYPNRWTHHVLLAAPVDVDGTVAEFLRQSYEFSQAKRRRR